MKQLIPVLNGNDAITHDAIKVVSNPLKTESSLTSLTQFSRIKSVNLRPLLTAKSLHSLPPIAIQLKLSPEYYLDDSTVNEDDFQPYDVSTLRTLEDGSEKIPQHLQYQYILDSDELEKAIKAGLYEDSDLFKARLNRHMYDSVLRRNVPVEITKTSIQNSDFVEITDVDTEPFDSKRQALSSVNEVFKEALAGVDEEYQDDIAKAEIEARQKARELEEEAERARRQRESFDELDPSVLENSLTDMDMFSKIRDLKLGSVDGDILKILREMKPEDTVTLDEATDTLDSDSFDIDEDELVKQLQKEARGEGSDAKATSSAQTGDSSFSDRAVRDVIRKQREAEEFEDLVDEEPAEETPVEKPEVKKVDDSEPELDV